MPILLLPVAVDENEEDDGDDVDTDDLLRTLWRDDSRPCNKSTRE